MCTKSTIQLDEEQTESDLDQLPSLQQRVFHDINKENRNQDILLRNSKTRTSFSNSPK